MTGFNRLLPGTSPTFPAASWDLSIQDDRESVGFVSDREWTSFLSPDALEFVRVQDAVANFLEGYLGMVCRQIEGATVDAYLSRDPDEDSIELVIRILGHWKSEDERLEAWRQAVADADDLWGITLRNRGEAPRSLPLSILVW